MKFLLTTSTLLLGNVYLASFLPTETSSQYSLKHGYPRFIKFPDGNGVLHDVALEEKPNMALIPDIAKPENNLYLLYTRRNHLIYQSLLLNNSASVTRSNFRADLPTVVVCHGWLSNQTIEPNPTFRQIFLEKSDVNVIIVDWSHVAVSGYATAVSGIPAVGRSIAQFLKYLNAETGAPFESMHLIGFSLGAHVVGNIGRKLGGKVAHVTGLDPAGPLWTFNSNRLNRNDGVYVEAVHTDSGYFLGSLGIGSPVADVDFFPNGGISQPGCKTNVCNHMFAWKLFASSVTNGHLVGTGCRNTLHISLNTCHGDSFPLGNDDLRKSGSGLYRVNTGHDYPY